MNNAKKSVDLQYLSWPFARGNFTRANAEASYAFSRNSEADRLVRVNKKVKSPNLSNLKEMMKNFGTSRKEILSAVSRSL